jgi:hypothetical protein
MDVLDGEIKSVHSRRRWEWLVWWFSLILWLVVVE